MDRKHVCESPMAALTNFHRFSGFKPLDSSGDEKSELKVLAGLCSFWKFQGRLHLPFQLLEALALAVLLGDHFLTSL